MEESNIVNTEKKKEYSLISNHIFNFKIIYVWQLICHPAKLMSALGEWVDKIEYFESPNNKKELFFDAPMKFKVGSLLNFRFKSIFLCELKILEINENEFCNRIVIGSQVKYPISFKYRIIYNLFWNSVEENTLLIHEIICDDVSTNMFNRDPEENKKERLIMFKKIEEMLSNDIKALHQEESIILDISLDKLFEIVTDWRIFRQYVEQICNEIYYNGDPQKIGSEMKITFGNKNKYSNLKIIECSYKENNKQNYLDFKLNQELKDKLKTKIPNHIQNKWNSSSFESIDDLDYKFQKNESFEVNLEKNSSKIHEYPIKENSSISQNYFKEKDILEISKSDILLSSSINSKNLEYNCDMDIKELRNPKILNTKHIIEYKYVLECYEGLPRCPLQLLIFKLIKLGDKKSLLIFLHEFKQPVKQELIKKIGIEKKEILFKLKKSLSQENSGI